MKSGLPIQTKAVMGGKEENIKNLNEVSTSGTIVNAYNALIMAEMTK